MLVVLGGKQRRLRPTGYAKKIHCACLLCLESDFRARSGREKGRGRIVVYANSDGSDMGRIVADIRQAIVATGLLSGSSVNL